MNLKEKIFAQIQQQTASNLYSTTEIAQNLGVRRNTVSYYLNQLVAEKKIIKIGGKPVVFVDRAAPKLRDLALQNKYQNMASFKAALTKKDVFTEVIGYNSSLYNQIRELKAAASYPGGLPVLLTGATGTGKSYLAGKFYEYCVNKGYLQKDGKFVSFNCAEYADNPELLTSTLFGYTKGAFTGADMAKPGLFDEADGGMLFLDEVHRLDAKGQEKLFSYLDKGEFSPVGAASATKKVHVRLIFATTENIKSNFLRTFIRRIPVQITLPPIKKRTSEEIRSLILHFYLEHARKINREIIVDNKVFSTLVHIGYENNIGQLKNIVLLSLANALKRRSDEEKTAISVKLVDLPYKVLMSNYVKEYAVSSREAAQLVLKPTSHIKDFLIQRSDSNHIEETMRQILTAYAKHYPIATFKKMADEKIAELCDFLVFKQQRLGVGPLPLSFFQEILNQKFGYLQNDFGNDLNGNVILTLAFYFYYRQANQWHLSLSEQKMCKQIMQEWDVTSDNDQLISLIMSTANEIFNLHVDEFDNLFLLLFLNSIQKSENPDIIHGVVLAHGYSTASSIANVVNKLEGKNLLDSFDMPIDIEPEDIAQKIRSYVKIHQVKNGLILMVDMGSLEQIPQLLKTSLDYPIAIFNNVSTQLALFVADCLKKKMTLEMIVKETKAAVNNDYKIIYPAVLKKNILIICCNTGVGTASKIKQLLLASLPKKINLLIKTYDYDFLNLTGQEKLLKEKYHILAIVGTVNPKYQDIAYISLDQLVNGEKIEDLQNALAGFLTKKESLEFNSNVVRNFTIEKVLNSLTILDTHVVMKNIDLVLKELDAFLTKPLKNRTRMLLYVHISCMIERIIRKQPLTSEPEGLSLADEQDLLDKLKSSLNILETIYSISIPKNEVKYICELIINSESDINTSADDNNSFDTSTITE